MPTKPRLFVLNAPTIAGDATSITYTVLGPDLVALVAATNTGVTAQAAGYTAAVAYDDAWPRHGTIRWLHSGAEVYAEAFDIPAIDYAAMETYFAAHNGLSANVICETDAPLAPLSTATARAVTASMLQLSATDPSVATNLAGQMIRIDQATLGAGQFGIIESSSGDGVQQLTSAHWSGGVTPTGTVIYSIAPAVSGGAASDPLANPLSTYTASGTVGKVLADNLDAKVSSRSTYAGGPVASVSAPVTLTSAYDPAKEAPVTFDLTATIVSASGNNVVVTGLAPGKSYIKQAVYHLPQDGSKSCEARIIAQQSYSSNQYTFTFPGTVGTVDGPFSGVVPGDKLLMSV
jgi:hypothetical protein